MPLLSKPSEEAKIAIIFVTLGAITLVWTTVWLVYQQNYGAEAWAQYTCYGCMGTGAVLLVIGLGLGRIARAARQAEMPPAEITAMEAQISHEAASRAPIVTPTGLGGAAVTGAAGQVASTNPAGADALNPMTPAARVITANPPNAPAAAVNGSVNSRAAGTF